MGLLQQDWLRWAALGWWCSREGGCVGSGRHFGTSTVYSPQTDLEW